MRRKCEDCHGLQAASYQGSVLHVYNLNKLQETRDVGRGWGGGGVRGGADVGGGGGLRSKMDEQRQQDRLANRQVQNSNSKTSFDKDCSLGSVKT